MKFISTLLLTIATAGLMTLLPAAAQSQTIPANIQGKLQASLQSVDPTDTEAVRAAVKAAIAKNPSLAPDIVAFFVNGIGQALANNPTAAANVIPAFVLDAANAYPKLQTPILVQAIQAVPSGLKLPVVPRIVGVVVSGQGDPQAKASLLNAVYEALGNNLEIISELDSVAKKNKIEIVDVDGDPTEDRTIRYVANAEVVDPGIYSGDQGSVNVGGGGFGGSGGGSGNNNNPTPTPTPTPAPTPAS